MSRRNGSAVWWLLAAGTALAPPAAVAQERGIEVSYGRWWADSVTAIYSAALYRSLAGPVSYGIGVSRFDDYPSGNRTHTGGELTLAIGRERSGPYLVAAAGLGMRHRDGNLDAHWSAGLGYAVGPIGPLTVGAEARYRTEDQAVRGFWRLDPSDRRGLVLQGRLALAFGRTSRRAASPTRLSPPSDGDIAAAARDGGASASAAATSTRVVRTALDAMGTPYTWGGTDENGFDCSGLIQYAYAQHGIILPRVSRDQLRMGTAVPLQVADLLPGDLLGFSVERDRPTHIGLYVGDGQFIHSASDGVKLSSLAAMDPDSRWWQRRWVSARRVVQ